MNRDKSDSMESISIIIPPKPGMEHTYPKGEPITLDICSHSMSSLGKDNDLPNSKLPFTWKLYEMLEDVEENGQDHIISWVNDGEAFRVHNLDLFVKDIIPIYFKQSKYKSFQRQLYFYNFKRISKGPGFGSYYHPMFVRGNKTRCLSMTPKKNSKRKSITTSQEGSEGKNLGRVVSDHGVPLTSHGSTRDEESVKEEAPRRVSMESTENHHTPMIEFGHKFEEDAISSPRNVCNSPSLVSYTSEENTRKGTDRHVEQRYSLYQQSRKSSYRDHAASRRVRHHWQRIGDDEDDINDGAACSVFGSMIFHFVRGVPQF